MPRDLKELKWLFTPSDVDDLRQRAEHEEEVLLHHGSRSRSPLRDLADRIEKWLEAFD